MTATTQRKSFGKSRALNLLLIAVLFIWMVLAAFPFLWTLWGSFKVEGDFFSKANWVNALTGPLTIKETGAGSRVMVTMVHGSRKPSGWLP